MTFGLLLTVISALSWAGLDVTRKLLVTRLDPAVLLVFLTLGQVPMFVGWAIIEGRGIDDLSAYGPLGLIALIIHATANFLYLLAVRVSPLSLVVPLLALVPVFTVAVANPCLGELPSLSQGLGIGVVVFGILLLNASNMPSRRLRDLVSGVLAEPGSIYMIIVAILWAAGIVLDKIATRHASLGAHAAWLNGSIGLVALVRLAAGRKLGRLADIRGSVGWMSLAIAAATFGMAAQLAAIQVVLTGVVEAMKRAIGIVASVISGRVAFGEAVTLPKLCAVGLIACGSIFVILAV